MAQNSVSDDDQIRGGREQIAESQKVLHRLLKKGNRTIDALRCSRSEEEQKRRIDEEQIRQSLRSKLLTEAENSTCQNASIATKWTDLFAIEVPQDLSNGLESQRLLCQVVLDSKDQLISDMKDQVMKKDEQYVLLLKQQSEEITAMHAAMRQQTAEMKDAYQHELREVEHAFLQDRDALLSSTKQELDDLYSKRNGLEQEYIDRFLQTAEKYEELLTEIRLSDTDTYNALKLKLEQEIQTLERHLETMRATDQLNTEKLEYNYRVLVERDVENSATINQQKRKLSKQRDALAMLTAKHRQLEKKFTSENQKIRDEYLRITDHFKELQLKFEALEQQEIAKFDKIWKMKEEKIVDLVKKLLQADQIIQEQLLGWTWIPPNESIFRLETRNFGSDLRSTVDSSVMEDSQQERLNDEVRGYIESGVYHSAMSMICDEAEFLLNEDAMKLIESVPSNEQGFVKAEEIVQALGVKDASAFEALIEVITCNDDNAELENGASVLGRSSNLVHPNEVIQRLRQFVDAETVPQTSPSQSRKKIRNNNSTSGSVSRRVLKKEAAFWERLSNAVDSQTHSVWEVLQQKLKEYYQMIQRRAEKARRVIELQEHNKKLKLLLNQYLSSKINDELVIPPSQTI